MSEFKGNVNFDITYAMFCSFPALIGDVCGLELAPQACSDIEDASCEDGKCQCAEPFVPRPDLKLCVCAPGFTFVDEPEECLPGMTVL